MSWLKRTFKKVGNTVGDIGKNAVNFVSAPVRTVIGKGNDPVFDKEDFKTTYLKDRFETLNKIQNFGGKAVIAAGTVGLGLAASKSLSGGGKTSVIKSLTDKPSSDSSLMNGLKSLVPSSVRKLVDSPVGKNISKMVIPNLSKFNPISLYTGVPSSGSSASGSLNGSAESSKIGRSFISAGSKLGGILDKLPSAREMGNGALDGILDVFQTSDAGKEVQDKAVNNWFQDNMSKIMGGVIAVMSVGMGFLIFRKK